MARIGPVLSRTLAATARIAMVDLDSWSTRGFLFNEGPRPGERVEKGEREEQPRKNKRAGCVEMLKGERKREKIKKWSPGLQVLYSARQGRAVGHELSRFFRRSASIHARILRYQQQQQSTAAGLMPQSHHQPPQASPHSPSSRPCRAPRTRGAWGAHPPGAGPRAPPERRPTRRAVSHTSATKQQKRVEEQRRQERSGGGGGGAGAFSAVILSDAALLSGVRPVR